MAQTLPNDLLEQISQLISANLGLHFPPDRFADLERGLLAASDELGCAEPRSCMANLIREKPLSRAQAEILASNLTVGETYFFREDRTIDALRSHILPEIIGAKRAANSRSIRIWSAGCSSGEEPYTIAMILDEILPDLANWHVVISGTDINPHSLSKAKKGVFREWSFRETPAPIRAKYFQKVEAASLWKISDKIRNMVTFTYHNLAADPYPSLSNNSNAMDLILCRNALMYFAPKPLERALHGFHNCLVEGGWLIVSAAEVPNPGLTRFLASEISRFTAFRKQELSIKHEHGIMHESEAMPSIEIPDFQPEISPIGLPYQPEHVSDVSHLPSYEELLSLYEEGKYEAITAACAENSPVDAPSLILTARAHANRGALPEAVSWGERALSADKNNPAGYYLLATIQQEQGDLSKAENLLRSCLYLDSSFVLGHFSLGSIALQKKDTAGAAKHFSAALKFLRAYENDEILPESEGISSSRLTMIISSLLEVETT